MNLTIALPRYVVRAEHVQRLQRLLALCYGLYDSDYAGHSACYFRLRVHARDSIRLRDSSHTIHRRIRRRIQHAQYADLVAVPRRQHLVQRRILLERVEQTRLAPVLVLLVLIVAVAARIAPLGHLDLVPLYGELVRIRNLLRRDGEIVPDAVNLRQVRYVVVPQRIHNRLQLRRRLTRRIRRPVVIVNNFHEYGVYHLIKRRAAHGHVSDEIA